MQRMSSSSTWTISSSCTLYCLQICGLWVAHATCRQNFADSSRRRCHAGLPVRTDGRFWRRSHHRGVQFCTPNYAFVMFAQTVRRNVEVEQTGRVKGATDWKKTWRRKWTPLEWFRMVRSLWFTDFKVRVQSCGGWVCVKETELGCQEFPDASRNKNTGCAEACPEKKV